MSDDKDLLISGTSIQKITEFILMIYNGRKKPYNTHGSKNDITIVPSLADDNMELRIMENDWGREQVSENIYGKKGDVYIKTENIKTPNKVMITIAYYFGGYFSESNLTDPNYRKIKKNKRECIKSYFESIEGTNEV